MAFPFVGEIVLTTLGDTVGASVIALPHSFAAQQYVPDGQSSDLSQIFADGQSVSNAAKLLKQNCAVIPRLLTGGLVCALVGLLLTVGLFDGDIVVGRGLIVGGSVGLPQLSLHIDFSLQ